MGCVKKDRMGILDWSNKYDLHKNTRSSIWKTDIVSVITISSDMHGTPFTFNGRILAFDEKLIQLDTSKEFTSSRQLIDIDNIARIFFI